MAIALHWSVRFRLVISVAENDRLRAVGPSSCAPYAVFAPFAIPTSHAKQNTSNANRTYMPNSSYPP
ncbi:hypothetical protein L596_022057 [Steinernema carpocapsae]|uniref:Uncharacterized protein n=1 Tax=Steinernema carpocapsae TaxID=34508 RepID=A0A4U5MKP1_STECR|nr:hypothetical protein L596_022057 [Steinernema carpocapsae]